MSRTPEEQWERLTELTKLEDGWNDGYGKEVTAECYLRARTLIGVLSDPELRVYPTNEGGISLEAGIKSISIEPNGWIRGLKVRGIDDVDSFKAPDFNMGFAIKEWWNSP